MRIISTSGQVYKRYGWRNMLFLHVVLLSACAVELQSMASAGQPTPTATRPPATVATPTASHTPLPVPTSTNNPATLRTPAPDTSVWGEKLVEALGGGGYVIYIHGKNNSEIQTPENCAQQTTLSAEEQFEARAIGASFLSSGIPVGQILHSGSCSSYETAMLAFGHAENWLDLFKSSPPLRGERLAALRQILSTKPEPGTNNVFVGHGLDITDVTGNTFAAGEAAIYKPLGKTGYSFVAHVLPEAWAEHERDTGSLVQAEPYVSGSVPLEKIEPTYLPSVPSQSTFSPNQIPATGHDLLLPDLVTLPPTDLRIRINPADGHKILRFTNSIMNNGPGRMEIWGVTNPASGKMTVTQHIYNSEDSAESRVVGEFFFHPEHNHWHLGDFARYEIWSIGTDGELDSVVAVSNKISYCLRDDARSDIAVAASRQTYTTCNHERQGISAGWIDIYRYHLPGQSIDITFLPDSIYALRSTVDPENRLWEQNPANNTTVLYIEIEGNRVHIVESREFIKKTLDGQNQ